MKKTLLSCSLFCLSAMAFGQLTVNGIQNNQIAAFLQGNGLTITNLNVTAPDSSMIGMFNGTNSNIGINSGLILATGDIAGAVGPNNSGSHTLGGGNMGGDIDMDAIATVATNDVCILEFDAVANWNNIVFNYVFASEEYPEYECSPFNDVFALLVSGPGISGPYSNGARNMALVPGTNTQVAINTVNSVSNSGSGCTSIDPNFANYTIYYVDNIGGTSVQYDGFTTVLQANIALQAGQTYHFKIAVADASDTAFDSAVFLKEGSFSSIAPNDIPNIENISNIGIHPNPAGESVDVLFDANVNQQITVELIDLTGRAVYSQQIKSSVGSHSHKIELSSQKEGVYFLRLLGDGFQSTKRLVVKH